MIDFAKAWKIVAKIRKYPGNHNQGNWINKGIPVVAADNGDHPACGTTACFAAWGAFLFAPSGSRITSGNLLITEGEIEEGPVSRFTTNELNISNEQASIFYYHCKTIDEIEHVLEYLEINPNADFDELFDVIGLFRE